MNQSTSTTNTMDIPKEALRQTVSESDNVMYSRNPITGIGLNGDGVGGLKPKIPKNRVGNPVTGEGYRNGQTDVEDLRKVHRRQATFTENRP